MVLLILLWKKNLVPYSPELNPIEQLWAIRKGKVKRTKLSDLETLTSRIIEVSEAVSIVHLQNITQHSANRFENCRNKVSM
jgi:transposase